MNKLYIASIIFTSGETLDDDNPMSVRVVFDPETTDLSVEPPAYMIARDLFINSVQTAMQEYVKSLDREAEYEYIPAEGEEEWEDGEEEYPRHMDEDTKH